MMERAVALGDQLTALATKGSGNSIGIGDFAKQQANFTQFGPYKVVIFSIIGTLIAGVLMLCLATGLINAGKLGLASIQSNEMHAATAQRGLGLSLRAAVTAAGLGAAVAIVLITVNAFVALAAAHL